MFQGYPFDPTFGSFRVIRTSFTLGELDSLGELVFLGGVWSVDTVSRCTTSLSIGRASVFVSDALLFFPLSHHPLYI